MSRTQPGPKARSSLAMITITFVRCAARGLAPEGKELTAAQFRLGLILLVERSDVEMNWPQTQRLLPRRAR